jgi:hypothetical protein
MMRTLCGAAAGQPEMPRCDAGRHTAAGPFDLCISILDLTRLHARRREAGPTTVCSVSDGKDTDRPLRNATNAAGSFDEADMGVDDIGVSDRDLIRLV